ncbi:MAG: hypothetical protein ABI763_07755 [Bacteroidota bacterium]
MKIFFFLTFLIALNNTAFGQADNKYTQYPDYWSSEREYKYIGLYIDSAGQNITTEKITLHPTGQEWEADSRQTLMDFTLDSLSADWRKLPDIPINGIHNNWMSNYHEGVLQNSNKIWMHPIRQNQYRLTEIAPFPQIIFPIRQDTSWKDTLFIYPAMGTFEGTVESTYTISADETRDYEFGKLNCWKITAIGIHDKLGINSVIYYFNDEFGFTEMNYTFYNKQKIEFKLVSLKK